MPFSGDNGTSSAGFPDSPNGYARFFGRCLFGRCSRPTLSWETLKLFAKDTQYLRCRYSFQIFCFLINMFKTPNFQTPNFKLSSPYLRRLNFTI